MKKEDLERYSELNNIFIEECERVCGKMKKLNPEYGDVDTFYYEDGSVVASGDHTCRGEWYTVSVTFDSVLLTFSDEELDEHIAKTLGARKLKEEQEKKKNEDRQREQDLVEYNRLKEKLGL